MISVHAQYPPGTAKGGCYLCHAGFPKEIDGRVERLIDLGVNIKFEGGLVICELCLREAGRSVGMLDAVEAQWTRDMYASVLDEMGMARAELARLRDREADVAAREEWMAGLLAAADARQVDAVPDPPPAVKK